MTLRWFAWEDELECKLDEWIEEDEVDENGAVDDNEDDTTDERHPELIPDPPPSPFDITPPPLEHDKAAPTNPLWPKLWLSWLKPAMDNNMVKYYNISIESIHRNRGCTKSIIMRL